jgi:hypothetical protein
MPKPITTNTLFYGNNLDILREYIADENIQPVLHRRVDLHASDIVHL